MANIANLSVSLSARIGKFQKNFAKARKTVNRFSRDITKSLKTIGGIGLVIGGILAGGTISSLVSQQFKLIDSTAKFADVIGLTTEQLTGYQFAAKITGVEQSQLNTGLARFQKNIGDARNGLSTATRAFEDLGLSYKDIINLSPDEQLKIVADRFRNIENQAVKTNVLLNLFGRSGLAAGKLLEQGSKGIERFQKENKKLNGAFSRLDAAKVEEANDAMARLRLVIDGIARRIAVDLAPLVTALANRFVDASTEGDSMGRFVTNSIDNILTGFGKVLGIVDLVKGSFFGFKSVIELIASGISRIIGTLANNFQKLFDFNPVLSGISKLLKLTNQLGFTDFDLSEQFKKTGELSNSLADNFLEASKKSGKEAVDNLTSFAEEKSSKKFSAFFQDIQRQADAVAKKSTSSLGLSSILEDGLLDESNRSNRVERFQQIDLSRISVGGIQSRKNQNIVNDPQLQTTNNLLESIKSTMKRSPGAVAA